MHTRSKEEGIKETWKREGVIKYGRRGDGEKKKTINKEIY